VQGSALRGRAMRCVAAREVQRAWLEVVHRAAAHVHADRRESSIADGAAARVVFRPAVVWVVPIAVTAAGFSLVIGCSSRAPCVIGTVPLLFASFP